MVLGAIIAGVCLGVDGSADGAVLLYGARIPVKTKECKIFPPKF
jgi:hypothetical protein